MYAVILVPLDGSPLAERALPYAAELARATRARLVLLRAVLVHELPGVDPSHAQVASVQRAEADLTASAEPLRAGGLAVDVSVYYDQPGRAILDAAAHRPADLIVMSTHGRSGPGRWIFGSVADDVLRHARVPVLLVPGACQPGWAAAGAGRQVLVPLDGSELAEEALAPACELAERLGAGVRLLRVVEPPVPLVADELSYPSAVAQDAELAAAQAYLDRVLARLRATGRAGEGSVLVGDPATTIPTVAREQGVDVIAMATHGRSGLARLVLGSVATGVLQRAAMPLLLVRPAAVHQTDTEGHESGATGRPITII
jgi:nucleotide-binding universal stress UspA family protein